MVDCAQAIRHLEAFQHPLFGLLQSALAQRTDVELLAEMHNAVQHQEEVAPGDESLIPAQVQVLAVAAADKQFINAHLRRNLLERLLGKGDGERHQDGARP